MNYYQKAYNLLKNDYRRCHLSPCDPNTGEAYREITRSTQVVPFPSRECGQGQIQPQGILLIG